jgi:hypothetical protein
VREIDWYPGVRLAHEVSRQVRGSVIEFRFKLTEVLIDRPEEGTQEHKVVCGYCKGTVSWRIRSEALTKRARRKWLLLALAGLALLSAAIGMLALYGDSQDFAALLGAVIAVGAVGGFLCFTLSLFRWWSEYGVRASDGRWLLSKHSVRR